ncbi:MAG: GFA family protein [Bradyrhizobiaceae bacterium]|nr:GFA family protein [Bradyrhizobiaceae bacterium]
MKQTYSGGCQCGAVRYEVSMELGDVISCNCSRCGRLGSLLAFAPAQDFTLKFGADALTDFRFNKHVIHHLFCKTCGIESFARGTGPGGAEMVAINARCLDGVDPASLNVVQFDGRSK